MHIEPTQLSWFAVGLVNVLSGLGLLIINSHTNDIKSTTKPQRLSVVEDDLKDDFKEEKVTVKMPIRPEWDDEDL